MRLLSFLLQASKKTATLVVLSSVISGVCGIGFVALTNTALHKAGSWSASLMWGFALLGVTMIMTQALANDLLTCFSQKTIAGLRRELTQKVLGTPLRQLEDIGASRVLAVITNDVQTIAQALTHIPGFAQHIALSAGAAVYLWWLSPTAFLWTAVTATLGIVTFRVLLKRAMHYWGRARSEQDTLYRHYRTLTEGTKELKLHKNRREAFLSDSVGVTTEALERFHVAAARRLIFASSSNQFIFLAIIGVIVFALPNVRNITTATLTGYVLTILYLMGVVRAFMGSLNLFGQAEVSMQRVEELGLSLAHQSPEHGMGLEAYRARSWDRIEMKGIVYRYSRENGGSEFVLGPIDVNVRPGELIFLVGGNGSGKSTFVKLFTGLYIPEAGEIYCDGKPITDENREWYRQHFSVVFSDFYLFETLQGLDTAQVDNHAREYLKQFQLAHKVQVENGAFSTTDLSVGQRKRLALLTAYLEDRPIYVLDEWAAEQDREFRAMFYTRLLPELKAKGKTVLVISHDERYYYLADRVLKLEYGQVVSSSADALVSASSPLPAQVIHAKDRS